MSIEVILTLKDLASGGMRKFGTTTQDVFKGINRSITVTNGKLANLGKTAAHAMKTVNSSVVDAKDRISGMDQAVLNLNNSFSESATTAKSAMKDVCDAVQTTIDKVKELNDVQAGKKDKASGGGFFSSLAGKLKGMWNWVKKLFSKEWTTALKELKILSSRVGKEALKMGANTAAHIGKGYKKLASAGWEAVKEHAKPFAKNTITKGLKGNENKDAYTAIAGEQKGGALYKDVDNFARSTVYGPELHDTARSMLELGMNAERVMPAMRMLGEVAAGNQEKMDMLSVAFAKTTTSGKLTREEFDQFKKAGFDPLEGIAAKTGTKYSDLQKQVEGGGISSGMVSSALTDATGPGGEYSGALAKAAQSPQGMMQNLKNTVEQAQIEFGVALAPAIGQLLTALQPLMDHLPVFFQTLQPIVETLFARIGELMPPILDLADAVFVMIKPILDLLVSPEITQLLKNFIDLGAVIAKVLTPVIKIVAWIIGKVVGAVNAAFEWVRKKFGMFMKEHPGAGEGIKKLMNGIDELTGSKDPDLKGKPALATVAEKPTAIATMAGSWKPTSNSAPVSSQASSAPITGGGQKIIRISFRNVVEKMYNTVADTTGLVNNIEPRLDEAINRILAGVS